MTDRSPDPESAWTLHEAIVNGVRLQYVEAGTGPLVVLLHGFPAFWYCWKYQIGPLAAAGYRVVALDMRGYNRSEKPPGVQSYAIAPLVGDVAALIAHCGAERATLVGHDWGGMVAWATAILRPEVVERLVVLNAPHPGAMLRELRTSAQLARSWYIFAFQLPVLPEFLLGLADYWLLRMMFQHDPARRDAVTAADIRRYRDAFAVPGARTATINYYRAMLRQNPRRAAAVLARPVAAPTLLIWGMKDRYLGPKLLEGLEAWVPDLRVVRIAGASHWVQLDQPERVNALIVAFLSGDAPERE